MRLRLPLVERIWRVRGSLALDEPLPSHEVFARLDPLFATQGTHYSVDGDALEYEKKNPAAQDKLATFTSGALLVEQREYHTRLSWELGSTALFLCCLAPLLFLAIGGLAAFINEIEKPALAAEQAEKKAEKEAEKDKPVELHWIDQMLGAPEPKGADEEEKDASRAKDGDGREDAEEDEVKGRHSPETAYVLAGIFALIYAVGRVLEPYLVKRTFRAALRAPEGQDLHENNNMEANAKIAPPGRGTTKTWNPNEKTGGSDELQHQ